MKRAAVVVLLLLAAPLYARGYRVVELPGSSGPSNAPILTAAYGLSDRTPEDPAGVFVAGAANQRAVRWTVNADGVVTATELVGPESAASVAYGVNDLGHVVGTGPAGAFFWSASEEPPLRSIGSSSRRGIRTRGGDRANSCADGRLGDALSGGLPSR